VSNVDGSACGLHDSSRLSRLDCDLQKFGNSGARNSIQWFVTLQTEDGFSAGFSIPRQHQIALGVARWHSSRRTRRSLQTRAAFRTTEFVLLM
jgi:hypothetical protein